MDFSFSRQITRQMVHAKRGALQHEIERVEHTLRALRRWGGLLDGDPQLLFQSHIVMLETRVAYLRELNQALGDALEANRDQVDGETDPLDEFLRSDEISLPRLTRTFCSVLDVCTQSFPRTQTYVTPPEWQESASTYLIPEPICRLLFLPDATNDLILVSRPETRRYFESLEHSSSQIKIVTGPPGVGKSTNTFAFAMKVARIPGRKVLWNTMGDNVLLCIDPTEMCLFGPTADVSVLLEQECITDVFVDQFCANDQTCMRIYREIYNLWIGENRQRRLTLITSEGFNKKLPRAKLTQYVWLAPWTREDLVNAVENLAVRVAFKNRNGLALNMEKASFDEFVKRKFHFTGGSARYFFEMTIDEIRTEVQNAIQRVSNMDALVRGDVGTQSSDAVNTLIYTTKTNSDYACHFTSDYVAQCVWIRAGPFSFHTGLYKFGPHPNRGNVGHHFQGYTVAAIGAKCRDLLPRNWPYYNGGENIGRTVREEIKLYSDSSDIILLNTWYLAEDSLQSGYDMFRVQRGQRKAPLRFIFLQITCGKSHTWNPNHFADATVGIQRKLNNQWQHKAIQVDVEFIIPEANANVFKVNRTGDIRSLHQVDRRWTEGTYASLIKVSRMPHTDIFASKTEG